MKKIFLRVLIPAALVNFWVCGYIAWSKTSGIVNFLGLCAVSATCFAVLVYIERQDLKIRELQSYLNQ